jgi:predicted nucleotide-binding protein
MMPLSSKTVFVVHGRNDAARRETFDFLRAIGLTPLPKAA